MLLLSSDIPEKIMNKVYAQENENNSIDLKITDGIASGDITNDSVVISSLAKWIWSSYSSDFSSVDSARK